MLDALRPDRGELRRLRCCRADSRDHRDALADGCGALRDANPSKGLTSGALVSMLAVPQRDIMTEESFSGSVREARLETGTTLPTSYRCARAWCVRRGGRGSVGSLDDAVNASGRSHRAARFYSEATLGNKNLYVTSASPYFFNGYRLPLHNGEEATLTETGVNEPVPIADDGRDLYVGSFDDGTIFTYSLPLVIESARRRTLRFAATVVQGTVLHCPRLVELHSAQPPGRPCAERGTSLGSRRAVGLGHKRRLPLCGWRRPDLGA